MLSFIVWAVIFTVFLLYFERTFKAVRLYMFTWRMKRYNERRKRWIIGKNCFEASYRGDTWNV